MSERPEVASRASRILKLKKEAIKEEYTTKVVPYLIVGSDLSSMLVAELLKGREVQYAQVLQEKFHPSFLRPMGPSLLRGEDNLRFLKEEYPSIEITSIQGNPWFYKDQKFSAFTGKRKSMEVNSEETFFQDPAFQINTEQLLPTPQIERINECFHYAQVERIERHEEEDLLGKAYYLISLSDKTRYQAEQVIWCESPLLFFRAFQGRKNLPTEFLQYCESVQAPWQLILDLQLSGPMEEQMETLFLPQSQTYEKGHYIVEFERGERPHVRVLCFLKESEIGHQEMEKKIRNIKSSLKRLFPEMPSRIEDEWIHVTQNGFHHEFEDELFEKCFESLKNFSFVGLNAPLKKDHFAYSLKRLSGPMRILASLKQFKKEFLH